MLVLGPAHLTGASAYWDLPEHDSVAYLVGYRHFLAEPWHFPPFVLHTINVPHDKALIFFDGIPLWAGLNKLVATVVPPWREISTRAYLGTWYFVVFVLQACLGVANLRALGRRSRGDAILTAALFLSLPAWIFRYAHASLTAHFLTLGGLWLYLSVRRRGSFDGRAVARFALLLAAAALVNPYHVAMVFGFLVVAVLETSRLPGGAGAGTSRRSRAAWLAALPVSLLALGAAAWLAGFFAREAKVSLIGFEISSSNLLSFFVPVRSLVLGRARGALDVEATMFGYEGYAYLGLGLLLLLVLVLPRLRDLPALIRRHPYLFAYALGLWLFSLSNHVHLGAREVFSFEVPGALRWVKDQYRAPGRFVWLPMYLLVVVIFRWGLATFDHGLRALVVPALVVLEAVDGVGDWRRVRAITAGPHAPLVDRGAWRGLVRAHRAIAVHPPYDCVLDGTPLVDHVSQQIEYVSSEVPLPINGVYSARPTRDCAAEERMRATLAPRPGTLYVMMPQARLLARRLVAEGLSCADFALGRVCSVDGEGAAAIRAVLGTSGLTPPAAPPELGAAREAGAEAGEGPRRRAVDVRLPADEPLLGTGWAWADPDGRWSMAKTASLSFRFGALPPSAELVLELSVALCGPRTAAAVDIVLDGETLATLQFSTEHNDLERPRRVALPDPRALSSRPLSLLELRAHDARSPLQLGCNGDWRTLGVHLRRLWVEAAPR